MRSFIKMMAWLAIGLVSRIVPRTNQIWVFGGNKGLRFADNSMFFFKYCVAETSKTSIWLTLSDTILKQVRAEGYRAYKSNSLLGLYYGFRARWHIFDVSLSDTNAFSGLSANQLNLWHGYPIKDIRFLKPQPSVSTAGSSFWRWLCNKPADNAKNFVLHQNRKYLWHITDSFDVREENVIIANYPRNIVFDSTADATRYIATNAKPSIEKLEKLRADGKRVLGYFPTWRSGDTDSFMGTQNVEEIASLNQFLAKHDLVIATKWHTCVFKDYQHAGANGTAESLNESMHSLSNVVVLDFEQDLNSLLNQCDLLISDYSGVIIDFLHTDRPQVFMAYDLETYSKEWGFLFDYETFIPGPIVKTISQLKVVLTEYAQSPDDFAKRERSKRVNAKEDLFEEASGSAKIYKFLEGVA